MAASFEMRRKELARLIGGLATVALVGAIWWFAHGSRNVVFTPDERVPFVTVKRKSEYRLIHPTLGFSVLHPGRGFAPKGSQAFRPDAQFYAFVDDAAREVLTIGLFKGQGASARSLRKLVEEMGKQADVLGGPGGAPVRVVSLDVRDSDPPRGEMHAIIGDGRHYQLSAYGWDRPDGAPIAVLIAVLSASPDAHAAVRESFQP
ncbi:MAG TPA: hypothetical protein VN903_10930 [Polyangia bacterium]|jgi:hypothetical protein|nr:hypothetical protein [Polyangia bacterium]